MTTSDGGDLRSRWSGDVHRVRGHSSARALMSLLFQSVTFRPIFTARLCQAYAGRGPAFALPHWVLRRLHRWAVQRAGIDMPWETRIGPGFAIVHGWGLVISPDARIGTNVTLFHGVTLGRKDDIDDVDGTRTLGGAPTLGDGVWIGPHAVVVGAVTIGDGARIGPGSVVTKDVPAGSLVVGNPAQVIRHDVGPDTPNPIPASAAGLRP